MAIQLRRIGCGIGQGSADIANLTFRINALLAYNYAICPEMRQRLAHINSSTGLRAIARSATKMAQNNAKARCSINSGLIGGDIARDWHVFFGKQGFFNKLARRVL